MVAEDAPVGTERGFHGCPRVTAATSPRRWSWMGSCRMGCVGACSADCGQGSQFGERGQERLAPWPSSWQVQRLAATAAGDPSGQRQQASSNGLGHNRALDVQSEVGDPAQQVVRQRREHESGGVGVEHSRRAVRQPGAVLQVTDRQFHHGVGAVLGVERDRVAGKSSTGAERPRTVPCRRADRTLPAALTGLLRVSPEDRPPSNGSPPQR